MIGKLLIKGGRVRKKELIRRINFFYGYLKRREAECEERREKSSEDRVQFNVTKIIKGFYFDEFFKILK